MAGTSSISGVISGMKTDEIISKLMDLEKAPITRMQAKQATLKTQLAAWQDANTRLLALKVKADALMNPGTFTSSSFISSDESMVTGSADKTAAVGTYFLKVLNLAQTHQVSTQGYADISNSRVGSGSITIQVGSGEAKTITIDSSNNTLAGLRDAINRSNAGVTAAIINDGDSSNPYRLLITSKTSGSVGHITITASLDDGTTPIISTIQSDQDALIRLGEGDTAITVTKPSNTIADLIPGMTLNLKSADPNKTVTINSIRDIESAKKAIRDFVDQYNNLMDFMNAQFSFDTETNTSGTLFSDSSLMSLQSSLRSMISVPLSGTDQSIKLLSQIGITSTSNDMLSINETELDNALSQNIDQVMKLFANTGESSNIAIEYISSSNKTKSSDVNGYKVNITRPATQARITAGVAQSDVLANSELLTINGFSIDLNAGMTQTQVISAINALSAKTGVMASATNADGSGSGNYLTLTSIGYGSAQVITAISSRSNGGTAPTNDTSGIGVIAVSQSSAAGESGMGTGAAGVDVAGTINGEPATGKGQELTGNSDNPNTADLKIRVMATVPGDYGTIRYTKGIASSFSGFINSMVDSSTGVVASAQQFIQSQIDSMTSDITDMQARIDIKQQRLEVQFAAMESALSKLQSQGEYLTAQITAMSNSKKQ